MNDSTSQRRATSVRLSVRKNFSRYEIKTLHHGKCLNDFYSLVAMHKKTHSFSALTRSFFDAYQLVNKNLSMPIVSLSGAFSFPSSLYEYVSTTTRRAHVIHVHRHWKNKARTRRMGQSYNRLQKK